ncbi:hypothetical protein BH23ACT5_BH23ACT5_09890 [soil metagenome]
MRIRVTCTTCTRVFLVPVNAARYEKDRHDRHDRHQTLLDGSHRDDGDDGDDDFPTSGYGAKHTTPDRHCDDCGLRLDPALGGATTHPTCRPNPYEAAS